MLDTLAEIEERGEAVRELEKSLLDLHQIFLDMAVLVEAQGEMLDNIEAQARASRLFWLLAPVPELALCLDQPPGSYSAPAGFPSREAKAVYESLLCFAHAPGLAACLRSHPLPLAPVLPAWLGPPHCISAQLVA